MSEHGFHVHGPHDHALEHEAHAEPRGLAGRLAVATAIIATIGALFSYMGGLTQANAGLYKNESAIKKTEASNQWNYYQAKSGKQNLAELAVALVADDRKPAYEKEVARYKSEKEDIRVAAGLGELGETARFLPTADDAGRTRRCSPRSCTIIAPVLIALARTSAMAAPTTFSFHASGAMVTKKTALPSSLALSGPSDRPSA